MSSDISAKDFTWLTLRPIWFLLLLIIILELLRLAPEQLISRPLPAPGTIIEPFFCELICRDCFDRYDPGRAYVVLLNSDFSVMTSSDFFYWSKKLDSSLVAVAFGLTISSYVGSLAAVSCDCRG